MLYGGYQDLPPVFYQVVTLTVETYDKIFTIGNRDSHRLFFLIFLLRVKEFINYDCRFGVCMKNCMYSHVGMSRIPTFNTRSKKIRL